MAEESKGIGILTLVLDKDAKPRPTLQWAVSNLNPFELKAVLRRFEPVVDSDIIILERELAKQEALRGKEPPT